MANTVLTRAWTLALGIILARILVPKDYGVYTVGLVVLNILQSMNELGVSIGVVRWPGPVDRVARTAVTMSLATSAALYGACLVAAPVVASALGTPEATGVLRLLTLGILLDAVSSIPNALLTRALQQGRRAAADITALAVSTVITLVLANQGFGAWSLAWGSLAGNAVSTTLILLLAPARPRPAFDRADARDLLRFGLPLAGSSFLVFVMLNLDYVVVGRVLGPVQLGVYVLAFNLSSWPANILSFSIRRVSIAGFGHIADEPERVRTVFARSLTSLISLVIPVCLVLSILAEPLVRFVYGERWVGAIPPLRYLAVLGGARVAFDLCYDVLVACGRSHATFAIQGLWVGLLLPALTVGARADGIRGVAVAHVVVALLAVGPAFLVALRGLGIRTADLARPLLRPAGAGVVAALVVLGARRVAGGDLATLAAGGLATAIVYAPLALPLRATLTRRRRRLP